LQLQIQPYIFDTNSKTALRVITEQDLFNIEASASGMLGSFGGAYMPETLMPSNMIFWHRRHGCVDCLDSLHHIPGVIRCRINYGKTAVVG
jgi:hypothetical protein